ncbi:MAG: MBL fold metallo-hydrolase [Thermoleophilaceae bacterium]
MDRRGFLVTAVALAGARWLSPGSRRQSPSTRLILLGTGGGPRPRKLRSALAQVIVANDTPYVVDCGDGVARQLVLAGVPLRTLRHIFITHHHSDDNADYGNLIWLGWTAGLRTRVDTWGPSPLSRMTSLFLEMNAYDIRTRIADEGRVPLAPLVQVHELSEGGLVMQDENVKVTAALVHHPPVVPAMAYRFDAVDRSIVISGDTTPSDALVRLAQGADVLVHEALYVPGVDRLVAAVPNAPDVRRSILSHHTSAEDAGRAALAAGDKLLVLSHLVPGEDPAVTDRPKPRSPWATTVTRRTIADIIDSSRRAESRRPYGERQDTNVSHTSRCCSPRSCAAHAAALFGRLARESLQEAGGTLRPSRVAPGLSGPHPAVGLPRGGGVGSRRGPRAPRVSWALGAAHPRLDWRATGRYGTGLPVPIR